ncbi:MAG: restriction endonuclease, partial [Acidobacteriota bacterium]
MKIGEVLRYPKRGDIKRALDLGDQVPDEIDGLRNFFSLTFAPGLPLCGLERGINPIAKVSAQDGRRTPAVLISSSPHKAGTDITPWQDHFRPDVGLARYFGDAKP